MIVTSKRRSLLACTMPSLLLSLAAACSPNSTLAPAAELGHPLDRVNLTGAATAA